jgi:F-type H+-transporting ATPase subunit a
MWFTAILNKLLAAPAAWLMARFGQTPANPSQPIPNYVGMEVLVLILIVAGALILRSRLSVEDPGTFQALMEDIYKFTKDTGDDIIGHGSAPFLPLLGTLFLYTLICNLVGVIPSLETPTAHIQVTLGCAVVAFLYYNYHGIRHHGVLGYLKHLCGPMLAMAFLMFPVEIIGNLGRLLSLSVRLYANMFVGAILEQVFTGLAPIAVPALFAALHIFVALLQAYIFMILPAIYIAMAIAEEH